MDKNPAGTDMRPASGLRWANGRLQQMWESENGLTGEWRDVPERNDTASAPIVKAGSKSVETAPRFTYEYRFVAACGLERKVRGSGAGGGYGLQQALNGQPLVPPKIWHPVKPDDFLSMTWEELEHVAHVIRDASRPHNTDQGE